VLVEVRNTLPTPRRANSQGSERVVSTATVNTHVAAVLAELGARDRV